MQFSLNVALLLHKPSLKIDQATEEICALLNRNPLTIRTEDSA